MPDHTQPAVNPSPVAGKLLIVAILLGAVSLAGFSWWFRYASTHRAARFWGPDAVRLVRDAPLVEACRWTPTGDVVALGRPATVRDVSHAPGMKNLRNALLEDRNFDWLAETNSAAGQAHFGLRFEGPGGNAELWVLFSSECDELHVTDGRAVSTAAIADGLKTVFEEIFAKGE